MQPAYLISGATENTPKKEPKMIEFGSEARFKEATDGEKNFLANPKGYYGYQ